MDNKISKKERKCSFKKLEGWFYANGTFEYAVRENSTKHYEGFYILKLKYVDPFGYYALYKGLNFTSQATTDNLISAGATMSTMKLKGAVASYDQNTGQIKLEIVSMDDKNIATYIGNGNKFRGTIVEFSLNTATTNDEALFGGFVGGLTLKKLKFAPEALKYLDFDTAYLERYKKVYPENV